jgi:hypothetical protein
VTAEARGEATWGEATIKDRDVGALIFGEVLQGKDEREEWRERGVEDIREMEKGPREREPPRADRPSATCESP